MMQGSGRPKVRCEVSSRGGALAVTRIEGGRRGWKRFLDAKGSKVLLRLVVKGKRYKWCV
jgi:hypothetical protein